MSTTFYDSPDGEWKPYAGGPKCYDRLSIDATHKSVWFFGHRSDDSDTHILLPLDELPEIADAINQFLQFIKEDA